MVRTLASHQCGLGSILGPGVMWVEFVVGTLLAPRGFSLGTWFPLSSETNILNFNKIWKVSLISTRVLNTVDALGFELY